MRGSSAALANPSESTKFWRDALAWRGSITPLLLPRIALFGAYAVAVVFAHGILDWTGVDPVHLGYTGGLLAVLLVFRTNASYDRWWEARRLWGGIVNQSRNATIKALELGPRDAAWDREFVLTVACFCHAARQGLRGQRDPAVFERILGDADEAARIVSARHMPTAIVRRAARLVQTARRRDTLDGFVLMSLDRELALLIDHVGACERILRTPMPRVHAIKLRRFIFLYLLGLPLALAGASTWVAPVATMLVAYPLLAIDQIGYELENPFDELRQSHLPLDVICQTIEQDLLAALAAREPASSSPAPAPSSVEIDDDVLVHAPALDA